MTNEPLDLPLIDRRFRLLKNGGRDDGSDVLGAGEEGVEWRNVHICMYTTVIRGQKHKADLAVGESTIVVGNLSGRKCDKRERESFKLLRVK